MPSLQQKKKSLSRSKDNLLKNMKKKIIIIGVVIIVVLAVAIFYFLFTGKGIKKETIVPLTTNYDISQDYCGKALDVHYCNCAFQGEDCETIGLSDKDAAYRLVTAGFEKWVIEKKKEECAEKGGRWVKDVCKK